MTTTREAALEAALTLARNRLQACAIDHPTGSREMYERSEWADEATAALAARPAPQPAAVECSVMKLVINEDRFLAAIDRAGDHEVSVGHPAADTRDADFVAEIAKGPPLGLSFMGWTNAMMLKARAIIGTATPAQSDKIAEAARERMARALREYQMQGRITVDWDKVPKSQRKKWFDLADVSLRALAGKGE